MKYVNFLGYVDMSAFYLKDFCEDYWYGGGLNDQNVMLTLFLIDKLKVGPFMN